MTDKERHEMMNLRKRVESQRSEIKRLTKEVGRLREEVNNAREMVQACRARTDMGSIADDGPEADKPG